MPGSFVTETHLVVPRSAEGPIVVSFDGLYVWAFVASRDGSRVTGGFEVPWPEVLLPRLIGTTKVRMADPDGASIIFDEVVRFADSDEHLVLQDGHGNPIALDKMGHITRVFSETSDAIKREVIEGSARALSDLRSIGIDAHISYGCLLGAIRNGKMIGSDSDADLSYISRFTEPVDLIRECFRIEREMRALGWKVVRMSNADLKLFLPLSDGRDVHIDIFAGFHVGDIYYTMGSRSGTLPRSALTPPSTVTLEGIDLPAPADPEAVLAYLYGASWRVPDPAYVAVDPPEGLRRIDGWMRGFRETVIDWNELLMHQRNEIPRGMSAFAGWVMQQITKDEPVAEIGCGNGRDTISFRTRGHDVLPFDFSGAALRQTRHRLTLLEPDRDGEPDVRALLLNDLRSVALAGAELAREPRPRHLYVRNVVGAIDDEARAHLWRLASMTLRRGGRLFVEFPSGEGPAAPEGLVQRVDPAVVRREIEGTGGRILTCETGPAPDFFDRPDPNITRIVATWASPTEESS